VIRGLVGIGLALLALLPLGAGVLLLTRTAFRFGLGMFAGVAAAMVLLPPLHYLGPAPTIWLVLALGAVALALGLAYGTVEQARERIEVVPALVLAAPLVLLAARGAEKPVDTYDAFANWTLKAKLLYFDRSFSSATIAPPVHREYPLGLPSLEAFVLHAIGSPNVRVLQVVPVVFLGGLALVAWRVLRPHVGAWPLTAGLSLVLWMPAARDQALSGLADLPLACLFASAALLFGGGELALGSVFAAAALATKRDAIAFVAVLYAVSFAAVLVRRERERLAPLAISAVCVLLTAVPWQVFNATHDLHDRDVSPTQAHFDELGFVLHRLGGLMVAQAYLWVLPLALACTIVMLVRGRDRGLALAVIVLDVALLAALVAVYLSGTTGIHYLVSSTAKRTLLTPTLLAAVLLPLLATRALGADRPRAARAGDRTRPQARRLLPRGRRRREAAAPARAPSS
jgi:hypothetical protein